MASAKPKQRQSFPRVDAVFIRRSGDEQEYAAQISNVRGMLKRIKVQVPDDFGSRRL